MTFGDGKLKLSGLLNPKPMPAKDGNWTMEGDVLNGTTCEFWQFAPYWDPPETNSRETARLRVQAQDTFADARIEI